MGAPHGRMRYRCLEAVCPCCCAWVCKWCPKQGTQTLHEPLGFGKLTG